LEFHHGPRPFAGRVGETPYCEKKVKVPVAPYPPDERSRLEIVRSLELLDTEVEERFDRVTRLAKNLFEVPISVVTLLDQDRSWFKSCVGLDGREMPRELSFCSYTILQDELTLVEDALADPRVNDNPLVTGEPHLRFHAGYPLKVYGQRVGSFCILDYQTRKLTEKEISLLRELGGWIERELRDTALNSVTQQLTGVRERYQRMIQESPVGVGVFDPAGKLLDFNPRLEELWGAVPGWLEDYNLLEDKRFTSAGWNQAVENTFKLGESSTLDTQFHPTGTSVLYLRVRLYTIQNEVIVMFEDVTEEALAREERAQALAEARSASAAKDQFLGHISHEMRTPLNGILGIAEILADSEEPNLELLNPLKECAESLALLMDDMLDLRQIEQGKVTLVESSFSLRDLIQSTTALLRPSAQSKNLELLVEKDDLGWVRGDLVRLRQILVNLLSNAIKYTERGRVVLKVHQLDDALYRFSVEDTGIGISPEMQSEIFEPFSQVQTSLPAGGVGLGLAIVKRLVSLLQGNLEVRSVPGEGSTFTVELKLPYSEPETKKTQPSRTESPVRRILLAEDNRINQRVLKLQLEKLNCQVTLAGDGQEALDVLAREKDKFALILLDCQMPKKDGYQTVRELRARSDLYGDPTVVALTASTLSGMKQRCLNEGMDGYLAKPATFEDLRQTLEQWA